MKKLLKHEGVQQKLRFVAVGVVNTLIDFGVLNILAHGLGAPRIPANIASASVAMLFSFSANRAVVFKSTGSNKRRQAALFLIVTMTSVYVLQNIVIYLLTEVWTWPLEAIHETVGILELEVFMTNAAKVVATGASLVWNYLFYKNVVFKNDEE